MNESNESSLRNLLESVMQTTDADANYNAGKALVNSVPGVGSLVGHFYETYLKDPLMVRFNNFLEKLVQELEELKRQRNTVDFANPAFQSAFVEARNIALHQHKEEKLEALKNIVLNSAIPSSEDEFPSLFLQWIDQLTVRHLVLLKFLNRLEECTREEFLQTFTDLEENKYLYSQALKDLKLKGLINLKEAYPAREQEKPPELVQFEYSFPEAFSLEGGGRNRRKNREDRRFELVVRKSEESISSILEALEYGWQKNKTTQLGKKFLEFIENPLNASEPASA